MIEYLREDLKEAQEAKEMLLSAEKEKVRNLFKNIILAVDNKRAMYKGAK